MIGISMRGVARAIRDLIAYQRWLRDKTDELANELATVGYNLAFAVLSDHVYSGATLSSLTVEKLGFARYVVKAESEAILLLEFGSGLHGYGHPEPQGYGPGTYPGQTHALDPQGWWFETTDPALAVYTNENENSPNYGKMYGHSYGNPPYMPMYGAVKELENRFDTIVQGVFGT